MRQGERFSGVKQPYLYPPGWDLESECNSPYHLAPAYKAFPCAERGEWFSGTVGTWSCFTPTFVLCSHMKGHYANYSLRASSSASREIPRKETRVRGAGFAARSLAINGGLHAGFASYTISPPWHDRLTLKTYQPLQIIFVFIFTFLGVVPTDQTSLMSLSK